MSVLGNLIGSSKKIVIKIGSNVMSDDNGKVNRGLLRNIVNQASKLMAQGKQVVIVSSGAGICGVGAIEKWARRGDMNYKQALCAIGQVELMLAYKEHFLEYGIHVGQILLTREEFSSSKRTLNIRNTLFTLIDEGVVPIINENDTVCVDEFTLGDNDTLSAMTAILWNADALILLSDIDGLFDKDPKRWKDAVLIEEVHGINRLMDEIDTDGKSEFGTGGVKTKIEAAMKTSEFGIPTILLNGKKEDIIIKAMSGQDRGTVFLEK